VRARPRGACAAVMKRQRLLHSILCAKRHSSEGTNSQPLPLRPVILIGGLRPEVQQHRITNRPVFC
jgi:hypothetical protein